MSGLFDNTAGIINIAIAPEGVMKFVYPYEENKAVIGYGPAKDKRPHVKEEVQRAIQTGGVVLSLPYALLQNGQGIIARQAIFIDGMYWGLANVVLDVPPLLEVAGIEPMSDGLNLSLLDQSGTVFFGSTDVFAGHPVTYEVKLPEGNWVLAAVPSDGWGMSYSSLMWFYYVVGLIGIVSISLVTYLFINRWERLAYQVDQRTKELAQSN